MKPFPHRQYITESWIHYDSRDAFSSVGHLSTNDASGTFSFSPGRCLSPHLCLDKNVCKLYHSDLRHGSFRCFLSFVLYPAWNLLIFLIFLIFPTWQISCLILRRSLSQQLQANVISSIFHKSCKWPS